MKWTLVTAASVRGRRWPQRVPPRGCCLNRKASVSRHRTETTFCGLVRSIAYTVHSGLLAILIPAACIQTDRVFRERLGQSVLSLPDPKLSQKMGPITWSLHLSTTDWVRASVLCISAFTCWNSLPPSKHSGARTLPSQAFLEYFLYSHTFQNHSCDRARGAMLLPPEKHFSTYYFPAPKIHANRQTHTS